MLEIRIGDCWRSRWRCLSTLDFNFVLHFLLHVRHVKKNKSQKKTKLLRFGMRCGKVWQAKARFLFTLQIWHLRFQNYQCPIHFFPASSFFIQLHRLYSLKYYYYYFTFSTIFFFTVFFFVNSKFQHTRSMNTMLRTVQRFNFEITL